LRRFVNCERFGTPPKDDNNEEPDLRRLDPVLHRKNWPRH